MKDIKDNLILRIEEIVNTAYRILCHKISSGKIVIYNEASMQLHFGTILQNIGREYEFADDEHFRVILERDFTICPTCKSSTGNARCDILVKLESGDKCANCGIELKYFPKVQGETTTANRFSILMDIQNLEQYKERGVDFCYMLVYTTNKNYPSRNSTAAIKIGEGVSISGSVTSNKSTVNLSGHYTIHWDELFVNDKQNYFMLLKV